MNETQTESLPQPVESTQTTGIARRRLLRAGLAAGPVVLAVSGRSAMAGTSCGTVKGLSPMAWASMAPDGACVGTSHTITGHACGRSPGYWKPNCDGNAKTFQPDYRWPIAPCDKLKTLVYGAYVEKSWNNYPYTDFKGVASNDSGFANGTKFRSVFTTSPDNRSFSRILIDESASGNVEWHFCAAYLNCKAMAGSYAVTEAELKYLYENRRLVPGGKQLTAGQIKEFLNQTWI